MEAMRVNFPALDVLDDFRNFLTLSEIDEVAWQRIFTRGLDRRQSNKENACAVGLGFKGTF